MAGFSQDILTRIINVRWGGAKFVYGTLTDNALYYVGVTSAKSIDQRTITVPGPGDPQFGLSAYGSSYSLIIGNPGPNERRIPTFLICGNRSVLVDTVDDAGNPIQVAVPLTLMYRSNDGVNWTVVRQGGANPTALVWDEANNAFFYDQNVAQNDQIFKSSDGTGWALVSSTPTEGADDYKSEFLTHCMDNDCLDDLKQNVPDGVMSAPGAVTAKPVLPPIINYGAGVSSIGFASGDPSETWGSAEIVISALDAQGRVVTMTVSVPGVPKVFGVAVVGGVIMAGGAADIAGEKGAVAISFDLGVTWETIAEHNSPVTTMVGNARH